ncbi:MAG: SLC13 family permease [Gammaproteobacteria bacterium]|nr:SLC13 family permease [Gammaproteobacteria bacterium]
MQGNIALTTDMMLVLGLLLLAGYLFISEVVRVDVAALIILVLLGVLDLVPAENIFNGFASNAVIAIIAVMIVGAGLDRTGVVNVLANQIVKLGGSTENRILAMICSSVAVISGFMQNIGAAALFVPLVSKISGRTGIPVSRLLMPMGYLAIIGGTLTLVGSSPLILMNDLISNANRSLPLGVSTIPQFSLFDVTPIGIAMIIAGTGYFLLFGRLLLPASKVEDVSRKRPQNYFADVYGLRGDVHELLVTMDSPMVGMKVGDAEKLTGAPLILAIRNTDAPRLAPPAEDMIWVGTMLGVMGTKQEVQAFAEQQQCRLQPRLRTFGHLFNPSLAGITEVVIPPGSSVIGKTIADSRMRTRFGINVLAINRRGDIINEELRNQELQVGDCLVSHSSWKNLAKLNQDRDFLVASDLPKEEARPQKVMYALGFFLLSLTLIIFTDMRLSLALLIGAMGMVLSGVLSMDEAYNAVSWKTVFLLASLIPLGSAMESTATAAWLAEGLLLIIGDVPLVVLQIVLALLATAFTLTMSNVGAAVLLVPLAINVGISMNTDPVPLILIVVLACSNAFLLPTHQVNALVMGPGNYRVADFMRAGIGLSVLFIAVLIGMINLLY